MIVVDEQTDFPWKEYKTQPNCVVMADLATENTNITNKDGRVLRARKNKDYIVTNADDENDQWVVEKNVFEKSYAGSVVGSVDSEEPSVLYTKTGTVQAHQVDISGMCKTWEGDMNFEPGDYICKGIEGEVWPVSERVFKERYKV